MVKLNNNEINDMINEELGKEDIKSRIAKMKEHLSENNNLSGEEFSTAASFSDDRDVEKDEEMLAWKHAKDYLENGNIADFQVFKDLEGDMTDFLNSAIERGKLKFVKDAVENGADVNGFHYNIPMAPSLVVAASVVAESNKSKGKNHSPKETPEQIAERREIVKYLINQGAKLEKTEGFVSPLQAVCGINDVRDYETYRILAEAGAPINKEEVAHAMHDSELFHILIETGYKPTADDLGMAIDERYQKWTDDKRDIIAVMDDIINVNPEVIQELDSKENPIMLRAKEPKVGLWLMQHGADMTRAAENPIALNNLKYLKAVVKNGADITDGKVLRKAVHKRKDVWSQDTSRFESVYDVDKEMVKFLIENGSNVNYEKIQTIDMDGDENSNKLYKTNTLMSYINHHMSDFYDDYDPDVVQMLMDAGANVNYIAKERWQGHGDLSMADVCLNGYGHYNFSKNRLKLFKQLTDGGMKFNEKDMRPKTRDIISNLRQAVLNSQIIKNIKDNGR